MENTFEATTGKPVENIYENVHDDGLNITRFLGQLQPSLHA